MIIPNIKPFNGQHCESTATGTLLNQLGINLSEPMLFGLGEGLGFIFWNMKTMDYPFIGGRVKPDLLTQNIARNLKLQLDVKETTSVQKAWDMVKALIDSGTVVGLKMDCFHLEYFSRPFHFAGHYAAIYGYDNEFAYLVDTRQQGGCVKTSLNSLAMARNEKGPMSSKNLFYSIRQTDEKVVLEKAVLDAISNNAKDYLNPPINNVSYKGILKTSVEVKKWFIASKDVERDFCTTAMLMEKAGTGGALFRNLYRDFLKESFDLLPSNTIKTAGLEFAGIADKWTEVGALFHKAGKSGDINYIHQASDLLRTLSDQEKKTMELLSTLTAK